MDLDLEIEVLRTRCPDVHSLLTVMSLLIDEVTDFRAALILF